MCDRLDEVMVLDLIQHWYPHQHLVTTFCTFIFVCLLYVNCHNKFTSLFLSFLFQFKFFFCFYHFSIFDKGNLQIKEINISCDYEDIVCITKKKLSLSTTVAFIFSYSFSVHFFCVSECEQNILSTFSFAIFLLFRLEKHFPGSVYFSHVTVTEFDFVMKTMNAQKLPTLIFIFLPVHGNFILPTVSVRILFGKTYIFPICDYQNTNKDAEKGKIKQQPSCIPSRCGQTMNWIRFSTLSVVHTSTKALTRIHSERITAERAQVERERRARERKWRKGALDEWIHAKRFENGSNHRVTKTFRKKCTRFFSIRIRFTLLVLFSLLVFSTHFFRSVQNTKRIID